MKDPSPRSVVFVFGGATLGKTTFVARLSDSNWTPVRNKHYTHWSPVKLAFKKNRCTAIDTPGFDLDSTYDEQNFQKVEDMVKAYVRRARNKYQESATSIHFGAIYCYPVTSDQLSATARRDLRALVALCKCFQFNSFSIVPVWSLDAPEDHQKRVMQELLDHQQIGEIWDSGGQIFGPEYLPSSVMNHIITGSRPFDAPQDGVNWAARLAHARAQLETLPSDHDDAKALEIEQLKSTLKQSEDFTKSLLQSLALPAYNLERKTLAKDFDDLNREIGRIVKGIARHYKARRDVGIDKLLGEPTQLGAMHELLSHGRGDPSSAFLYHSNTSRHMSVKLFLQSAAALILCESLHERVFQPFHPGLKTDINEALGQMYQSVRNSNNDTMSGKWRRDAFIGVRQTAEQTQQLQSDISSSMKESILQILRILAGDPGAISAQQQAAFSTLDRPFAPVDALVRKAFDLNEKIKTEAVLIGNFSTLYYPPGSTFDSRFMSVDGAVEDQGEEETQRQEGTQANVRTILSTFGLGLITTSGTQTGNNLAQRGRQSLIINRTIVTDESSCDVIYPQEE